MYIFIFHRRHQFHVIFFIFLFLVKCEFISSCRLLVVAVVGRWQNVHGAVGVVQPLNASTHQYTPRVKANTTRTHFRFTITRFNTDCF